MKVKFEYDGEEIDVKKVFISINGIEYRITECDNAYKEDGNININKASYDDSGSIRITPCVSNVIMIK